MTATRTPLTDAQIMEIWCDDGFARKLELALAQAKEALRDMRDHGLRFDLNPTVCWSGESDDERFHSLGMAYLAYIKRMDERLRDRALGILRAIEELRKEQ